MVRYCEFLAKKNKPRAGKKILNKIQKTIDFCSLFMVTYCEFMMTYCLVLQ